MRSGLGLLALVLLSTTSAESDDTCDAGTWSALLEEWATQPDEPGPGRQGRIMALPPTKGYYVTDRVDGPLHHHPPGPPPGHPKGPPPGPHSYDEWHMMPPPPPPSPGKIVNRPPNKDKFRPSPAYPSSWEQKPPQGPGQNSDVDRVDNPPPPPQQPPRKQVTETDLYLLGAIEKLVYRVDLMEKRLRKMEESMLYMVAGNTKAPVEEPCAGNMTRVGGTCYHFAPTPLDWKNANLACRRLQAHLLEFRHDGQRRQLATRLQGDSSLRDSDWWTGGLNPGLLWIWSSSGRPILANSTAGQGPSNTTAIAGEGRCLALLYEKSLRTHVYKGQDCAFKHRYICEKNEDKTKLSNEIERVAKSLRPLAEIAGARAAKLMKDFQAEDTGTGNDF